MKTQVQPELDFILNEIVKKRKDPLTSPWKKTEFIEHVKEEMRKNEIYCHDHQITAHITKLKQDGYLTENTLGGISPTTRGIDKVERKIGFPTPY